MICHLQDNITYSTESLNRAKPQFDHLQVKDPEDSEFYRQFKKMSKKLGLEEGLRCFSSYK